MLFRAMPSSPTKPGFSLISSKRIDPENNLTDFSEERALVQRCLAGEQKAWSELIEKHRAIIYSIARRFGAGYYDAGDIFQAVAFMADYGDGASGISVEEEVR
jgi:DNA-directed RNA polymerase sigma subunit (sigma70/sigma32)